MNERIRELAINSQLVSVDDRRGKLVSGWQEDVDLTEYLEDFAHMIVQECIRYVQYRTTDWDADLHWIFRDESGYMEVDIESLLQEHFGYHTSIEVMQPAEAQEPVAWYAQDNLETKDEVEVIWNREKPKYAEVWMPLYGAPPKQEWVGLTDEDLTAVYESEQQGRWGDHIRSLQAIEAKIKERNTR